MSSVLYWKGFLRSLNYSNSNNRNLVSGDIPVTFFCVLALKILKFSGQSKPSQRGHVGSDGNFHYKASSANLLHDGSMSMNKKILFVLSNVQKNNNRLKLMDFRNCYNYVILLFRFYYFFPNKTKREQISLLMIHLNYNRISNRW